MENQLVFTTARLARLTCPADKDRVYYRDSDTLGLVLAVTATGSKVFYVYRRIAGRPARVRLGAWPQELGVDAARKEAAKANGDIAKGLDPRQAKRSIRAEMTLGELFTTHLENAKSHNKTWQENERQFERYLNSWRGRRLSEIRRADVQALHARVGTDHGKYAANRVLALLHHMFQSTAVNLGWTGGNPAHGIQKFKEKSRERFLGPDEMQKFLAALDAEVDDFRDFFLLALLTGARRANVQAMAWDDLHLDRAEWRIPETKSGDGLTVALVPEAVAILKRRKEGCSIEQPYVFPSKSASGHLTEPKAAWKRILARAGITDLRLHDLRRTFGSWQVANGTSLAIIGKSLGHKNQSTTAIYARLDLDPVRAAVGNATAAMLAAGKKGEQS